MHLFYACNCTCTNKYYCFIFLYVGASSNIVSKYFLGHPEDFLPSDAIRQFNNDDWTTSVSHLFVDKVHCSVVQWFPTQIQGLNVLCDAFLDAAVVALTATATLKMQGDIQRLLNMKETTSNFSSARQKKQQVCSPETTTTVWHLKTSYIVGNMVLNTVPHQILHQCYKNLTRTKEQRQNKHGVEYRYTIFAPIPHELKNRGSVLLLLWVNTSWDTWKLPI